MNATHIYKGKPVEYIERTYQSNGHWFCTILMVNVTGKTQRQTVQERHLTPFAPDKSGLVPTQAEYHKPVLSTSGSEPF